MENHSIGKTIAALRKEKGWTQIELAEKLQVSDKAVSKWEQDNGMPSIEFFPKMAQLFGVSIDYLMTGQAPEKEIITMSKAELCAKNDDVGLLKEIQADHKDENKKTLMDYIVQYESIRVFVAFCEMNNRNISKFSLVDALKLCLISNRLDLIVGGSFALSHSARIQFKDELEILSLLVKGDEVNFQGEGNYNARMPCVLTEEILNIIVNKNKVNEKTLAILLGNQRNRQCVWYHVFPFLIHQAYKNENNSMLDRLLTLSIESNERGFGKYVKQADRYGEYNISGRYYFIHREYDNIGHGFVRILEETIKLALEQGDFDYVDKFNQINAAVNSHYSFKAYIANADDIRVAMLKLSDNVSADELALQSAIHDGVLCIDEILTTNNYKLIKKAFKEYPIHTIEYLFKLYNAEKWRALFEYAVDNGNVHLADSVISSNKNAILECILKYAQGNAKHINSKYLVFPAFNPYNKQDDNVSAIIGAISKCKQNTLEKLASKLDKDTIVSELTKEFFEAELAKGNVEIVIIKLCVRMEAVLRCRGYEGTFEEMLTKFCSQFNTFDDEDNNYDPHTPRMLHKLRMYRNSIVHSEKNTDPMNTSEIANCIDYICKLG